MFVRHGDVLLTKVDSLPKGKAINHNGQYILAYGEITGHAHRLTVKDPSTLKVRDVEGVTFLSLAVPAPLTHEEHSLIEVPSGIWKMTCEREHDYAIESIRTVID